MTAWRCRVLTIARYGKTRYDDEYGVTFMVMDDLDGAAWYGAWNEVYSMVAGRCA